MHIKPLIIIIVTLLLSACMHPISSETRKQVSPDTTFAMVSENPSAFLDQHILLGGVVISINNAEEGAVLEVMEWSLNRWGEPLSLQEAGRRFLVKTPDPLDPEIYAPGRLVTLAGKVLGKEPRLLGEQEYNYPVFNLTEIYLWDSPFRYGLSPHYDPSYPRYVGPEDHGRSHPYDPGYYSYPYTPFWYR